MADIAQQLGTDPSSYDLAQRYFGVNPVAWLSDCAWQPRAASNGRSLAALRRHARSDRRTTRHRAARGEVLIMHDSPPRLNPHPRPPQCTMRATRS